MGSDLLMGPINSLGNLGQLVTNQLSINENDGLSNGGPICRPPKYFGMVDSSRMGSDGTAPGNIPSSLGEEMPGDVHTSTPNFASSSSEDPSKEGEVP